ncbi:MAG TPA: glycosyltransferase family 9 protein [Frankiaceae bacterium]|nr:glycosyltransferase family 9 protein [Frankiaceae bacterium]
MTHVVVARLDNDGDVLLSGPAIRAVAASGARVTLLVGPRGRQAAALLPGVDDVVVWHCPWIDAEPEPVERGAILDLVDRLAGAGIDAGLILTSFHQSPLPLALMLRMAGVRHLSAHSVDYPGSLLDVRHQLPETGLHEVERALSTAGAAGFPLPPDDDGRLGVRRPLPDTRPLTGDRPYVVVHPGASVPARSWPTARFAELVPALVRAGHRVVVTGGPNERTLTAAVSGAGADAGTAAAANPDADVLDLGGRTDLAGLADLLDRADAVVVGNTGPAHLAAAVDTPVVSLFAPTVPSERWAPYTDDRVLLGDLGIACAGCRARTCPVVGHPCLTAVGVADVVLAVKTLAAPTRADQFLEVPV